MVSRFIGQSFFIPSPSLTEKNLPDQTGKVIIVTGGYVGVGYELTKILYQHNATIYIAGRSKDKASVAIETLQKDFPKSKARIEFIFLDLADLTTIKKSVDDFLAKEEKLDVLVNNAGLMTPPKGTKTVQGYELQMGTNCVGPFLFTSLLTPILVKTAEKAAPGSVRVTWASSFVTENGAPKDGITLDETGKPKVYEKPMTDYSQSKAGNYFYAAEFARRFGKDNIISVAFNPGNLNSNLQRHGSSLQRCLTKPLIHPPVYGAYTELFCGWSSQITQDNNGCYVIPWGRIDRSREDVRAACVPVSEGGTGIAQKFWNWSESEVKQYM